MRRLLAAVLVAGLGLGACGSQSSTSALRQWSTQSNFDQSMGILLMDARHAASALRSGASLNELHTVCAVLLIDVQSANAALPTPDAQASNLLSRAYSDLGAGANRCYVATSPEIRARALADLSRGAGEILEARARVASA